MQKDFLKSSFIAATAVLSLLLSGVETAYAKTKPSSVSDRSYEQVEIVKENMIAKGQQNFAILDKKNGKIIFFNNGQELFRADALFGSGDDKAITTYSTPVGEFRMKVVPSMSQAGTAINFLCPAKNVCLSIHATSDNRLSRLGKPSQSAISAGCIGMRMEEYKMAAAFVGAYQGAGQKLLHLAILPRDGSLERTRAVFKIPEKSDSFEVTDISPRP